MSKSKLLKKTVSIAMTIGLAFNIAIAPVTAAELYSDATVGISSAFDRYVSTITDTDKESTAAKDKGQILSTSSKSTGGDDLVGNGKKTEKSKEEKTVVKYPEFEGKCIAITEDYVNIRTGSDETSDIAGIITNNGIATVLEKGKEWTRITSGDCTGYIRNDLLLFGDDAGAHVEANCTRSAKINTDTLNVRQRADVKSDCITQVAYGQVFDIVSDDGKWIEICVDEELTGFVSAEFVEYTYNLDTAKTIEQLQAEADAANAASQDEEEEQDFESEDTDDEADIQDDTEEQEEAEEEQTDIEEETTEEEATEETTIAAPSGQSGIDLANFALQFVGNPYVYGGSSLTDGADCSGFVMAVYAEFGYSLPHSAGAQSGYGVPVDTSSLEPGDIVFYGDGYSIEHCAIYVGDGVVVHASTEETGIKTSPVFYRDPMCAVRLLGQ